MKYFPVDSRAVTKLIIPTDHATKKIMHADWDVAVRIEIIEMVAYALTAKHLASKTLVYAWLAGLAALTQG